MTHQFSLILNRELTNQEIESLRESSPANVSFVDDVLPVDAEVRVTRVEFEDEVTATLAEAIEAGFEVVKAVPDLSIPGLRVPAQPAGISGGEDEGSAKEKAGMTS